MNNPPFSIGQKIIRIGESIDVVIKGNVYTCHECFQCPCGKWKVTLSEFPVYNAFPFHCGCGHSFGAKGFKGGMAEKFAPIQTNYSDATSEILEKFKSPAETPDKILTPEKVKV